MAIAVTIHTSNQTVDAGAVVTLDATISGWDTGDTFSWLEDGFSLPTEGTFSNLAGGILKRGFRRRHLDCAVAGRADDLRAVADCRRGQRLSLDHGARRVSHRARGADRGKPNPNIGRQRQPACHVERGHRSHQLSRPVQENVGPQLDPDLRQHHQPAPDKRTRPQHKP